MASQSILNIGLNIFVPSSLQFISLYVWFTIFGKLMAIIDKHIAQVHLAKLPQEVADDKQYGHQSRTHSNKSKYHNQSQRGN